ncbi:hypothetical protein [Streptomyces sp. SID8352]|uniref:hypothetical protein n=1 Tax=Streptomyces sp. SID8352 TaxID=2690338 RepID=UPI0013687D36|nr:hypothetical protein [Streptomyces sp. SID8352]MYU24496.1 hypothetical protein [Streptomyces sp. SID8352]
MTQQNPSAPESGGDPAARAAELHAQCRADYEQAEARRAQSAGAARDQYALATIHAADTVSVTR